MSAYVCDDKTINRVVYGIFQNPFVLRRAKEILGDEWDGKEKSLGLALHMLNQKAVGVRYSSPGSMGDYKGYKSPSLFGISKIQLVKTGHCLRYQIDQGEEITSLPLFKVLEIFISSTETAFFNNFPDYDKAEWG